MQPRVIVVEMMPTKSLLSWAAGNRLSRRCFVFCLPLSGTTINIGLIPAPSLAIGDFLLKMQSLADQLFVQSTFEPCHDAELSLLSISISACLIHHPCLEEKVVRLSLSFLSVLVMSAPCVASDFNDLTRKVPQGANAVMAIDVAKTLASPLAKKEGWDRKLTDGGSDRPLYLPPEADKLLSAAQIDITRNFSKSWSVSLFGLTESVPIGVVARLEGGYVDKIDDVDVAWLPSDAYVMKTSDTTLVMQSPANRQAAARWISSQKNSEAMGISDYLGVALAAMNRAPHIVMALDSSNAIQRHRVEQQLQQSGFLEKHSLDMEQIAGLLASLQGTVLEITFTNKVTAMARIDFAEPVPVNKTVAKALVLAVLEAKQMSLPGIDSFSFSIVDKSIVLEGELPMDSLRRLLSLMEPVSTKFSSLKDANVEQPSGDDMAKNSLAYFQASQSLLKDLRQKAGSYNSDAFWIDMYSSKIDKLPILHVDDDLLDYGLNLTETLRFMSGSRKNARLLGGAEARNELSQGAIVNNGNDGYGFGNYSYSTPRSRETAAGNARANAAASGTAVKIEGWQLIDKATNEIRREMTKRYNLAF